MKPRVVIVDDSVLIRRIIQDWIREDGGYDVVGAAGNGHEAIEMCRELRPDVVTLDVEMPQLDGLAALPDILAIGGIKVLMVSSLTLKGADATVRALQMGAYDFVTKPAGSASFQFMACKAELLEKLHASKVVRLVQHVLRETSIHSPISQTTRVVAIASSTGGPRALTELFKSLPKGFPAPILLVQHMPEGFIESFAKRLDAIGTVPCRQAKLGEKIQPGICYLAPAGAHMSAAQTNRIQLTDSAPIHGVRPAADILFRSSAEQYGSHLIGVVLTGMGRDGAEGAVAIRKAGGYCIGEDESSSTIYGMPKAAYDIGGIDLQLPIQAIGSGIMHALEGKRSSRAS